MSSTITLDATRSCLGCHKNDLCIGFYFLQDVVMTKVPTDGLSGNQAPGVRGDVYVAMANCCLKYQPKKSQSIKPQ